VILITNIYTLWGRNAFFCLLHTFRRRYSTSNGYKNQNSTHLNSTSNGYKNKEERYSRLSDTRYSWLSDTRYSAYYQIPVTQLKLSDTRYSA